MMAALLKRFTFMTALGMAVLYTASTMVVSSRISLMRSMIILAFCVILTALGFVYLETDRVLLSKLLNQSRFYRSILQLAKNDWIRALFICCTCMFLPGVLGVAWMPLASWNVRLAMIVFSTLLGVSFRGSERLFKPRPLHYKCRMMTA